ncbi:hypothetical protein [Paractinoplanes globisporus]|uniref:Uncharacterized protein n=1 Tax=Paractinoplanes globisporus TaxID=113565 RepID=A0ABW6WH34_9ACTN|nr:hypothetical protein [Actinoplanes globisporus]
MARCTMAEAWRRISTLNPADASRLVGYSLLDNHIPAIPTGALTESAAQALHDNLYRDGKPATGDSIAYVVCSDDTPVAWVTYHAKIVLPEADLTTYRAAHQINAMGALTQLSRRALTDLARRRDDREHRKPGARREIRCDYTRVLVADPAEPTLTWWTSLPADPDQARAHLAAVTGGTDVLVLDAYGYGAYSLGDHLLPVPMLCTIEALAAEHYLPAWVVGDWLTAEGAPRSQPDAATVRAEFDAAYLGLFANLRAYARTEYQRRGWADVFTVAGIPPRLFGLDRFTADLFCDQVRQVRLPHGQIAVFRRCTG